MKLFEFFGNINHNPNEANDRDPEALGKEQEQELSDQVFWYILDHDDLHKKHFMDLAKEIRNTNKENSKDDTHDWKLWMPMVKEGCMEFFKEHKVDGHPADTFHKEFRVDLCKRLADHHHKDIIKDEYKLGH